MQRKIKEINPACYIFKVAFLRQYLKKVKKSPVSGEYYLTSLIDIAIKNKEKLEAVAGGKISWRGINTPQELKEAEKLFCMSGN
jgi:bifunctional UDP-N-acetylglucosamine pyrophosphorylase/glucosamine-1-phosphate N-acetyltransferase